MNARLLTTKDVADYLSLSTTTVRRMAKRGELPKAVTIGGVPRWDRHAIDKLLDALAGSRPGYVDPDEALADL